MKIKKGFLLREVAGNPIVVAVGKASLQFNSLITLNNTGVFLWKQLEAGAELEDLISAMVSEYDIDRETAKQDILEFLQQIKGAGIIE